MTNLREEVLIARGIKYWLLPNTLIGLLGYFCPLVYEVIPVHEAGQCLCSFFELVLQGKDFLVIN
jgi:hypothetical protein